MSKKIPIILFATSFVLSTGNAWELGENRQVETTMVEGKPLRKETEFFATYVGRYQLKPIEELFPNQRYHPEGYAEAYSKRLFTTEIALPNSPLNRYYVQDLQYSVIPSDNEGKALSASRGVRLIPITSGENKCRIPTVPINIRQRYPVVVADFMREEGLSPSQRVYECWYVETLLGKVQAYQTANNELPVLTDADITAMVEGNTEPTVGTANVESYASLIAYGKDDKNLPLHMIVPHTTASEFFHNDLAELSSGGAKPQTSIHHVSGFYRFEGDSMDTRRSMLSEGEPTNLMMVFSRKGKNNPNTTQEAIEGAQLNLSLWFMLYYENPEGYAFSDDYEFDDAYITNLEEMFEMARGWLNRGYIREDFNKLHSVRVVKRMNNLMKPMNKLLNEKDTFTKEDVEDANNNIWNIRSLVAMLYGPEAAREIEDAQEPIWQIMRKVQETENIRDLRLTRTERARVLKLLNLLKGYEEGAAVAAQKIPYYDLLQNDPTLAEYCNEGVKDQMDKGLNVPLARKWLYKIYSKKDADIMFDTAEKKICQIQIARKNKELTEAQTAQLATDPCGVLTAVVERPMLLRNLESKIEKMTPLFAAGGSVNNVETLSETNPLVPRRDENGAPIGIAANADRNREIRLIGNGLVYAPQTTLDIINNFSTAYVPFHKAGASASAAVAMGFLKEHLRRTGIDSETYVAYTSKILNELYATEAKIFKTQFAALPAEQQAGAWEKYVTGVENFYSSVLPQIIDNAVANENNEGDDMEENDGEVRNPRELPQDRPQVTGVEISEKLFTGGVKAAIDAATPFTAAEVVSLGGPAQFSFGAFKTTTAKVKVLVEEANHKYSTLPANAFEAIAQGTKRVKFYHQPGINALMTMGLVKVNPNALFVNVGTAVSEDQIVKKDIEVEKQYTDAEIDGGLLNKQVTTFVESAENEAAINKYKEGLYPNSIVGRPW